MTFGAFYIKIQKFTRDVNNFKNIFNSFIDFNSYLWTVKCKFCHGSSRFFSPQRMKGNELSANLETGCCID